jgi:hypothetical protein
MAESYVRDILLEMGYEMCVRSEGDLNFNQQWSLLLTLKPTLRKRNPEERWHRRILTKIVHVKNTQFGVHFIGCSPSSKMKFWGSPYLKVIDLADPDSKDIIRELALGFIEKDT